MKALNEIKERVEAFSEIIKVVETNFEGFVKITEFACCAHRDIPRLCEALEYLLGFLTINCEARDVVEQILSGTTENGKDADKVDFKKGDTR